MADALFRAVSKRFAEIAALDGFDLGVADGELITVLGPSGCGKSTLLRLTAGLESLSEGSIELGGRRIDTLPPRERDVAMVFQNYALYPHMTVLANIEFPLRMRGIAAARRREHASQVAALLELENLLGRRPAQLSGGQRQRVALARALVRSPALFLLDEPLSNLDARLRMSVRQHIRDVQRRLRVTTLYVTHDQTEAMTLGDRVVVMNRGRIQQVDPPAGVYERPTNSFVAAFVGTPPMNLLPARYAGGVLHVGGQAVPAPPPLCRRLGATQAPLLIGIRPESFHPAEPGDAAVAAVLDRQTRENLGSEILVRGRVGDRPVTVRLFGASGALPERVKAPVGALHFFSATDETRLM
jgi:ABC-type sugar transport system ATPase subunit